MKTERFDDIERVTKLLQRVSELEKQGGRQHHLKSGGIDSDQHERNNEPKKPDIKHVGNVRNKQTENEDGYKPGDKVYFRQFKTPYNEYKKNKTVMNGRLWRV